MQAGQEGRRLHRQQNDQGLRRRGARLGVPGLRVERRQVQEDQGARRRPGLARRKTGPNPK